MRLHIELDMDGAAFEDGEETSSILRVLANQLDQEADGGRLGEGGQKLMDSNGNTCGRAWTTEK
jgi:hypothetical protein